MNTPYTIPMALQDYMPVTLAAIGFWYLSRLAGSMRADFGRMFLIGGLLATAGGFCKATWKLIMAATDGSVNLWMLDNALFWLLGAGFILMTYTMSYMLRTARGVPLRRSNPWLMPAATIASFYVLATVLAVLRPGARSWNLPLLIMAAVANITLAVMLIRSSAQHGWKLIAALFVVNILIVLALSGLARAPSSRTTVLQWVEQISNSLSNAAFAFAAWKFSRLMQQNLTIQRA